MQYRVIEGNLTPGCVGQYVAPVRGDIAPLAITPEIVNPERELAQAMQEIELGLRKVGSGSGSRFAGTATQAVAPNSSAAAPLADPLRVDPCSIAETCAFR